MAGLDDELHSTLYPVWYNTYRVRTALELYEGVSTHADELQKHSNFFGLIQTISQDYAALGICRMFDQYSVRHRKDTVLTTFYFLKTNLTSEYTSRLKTETLMKIGIPDEIARNLAGDLVTSFKNVRDTFLNEIESRIPTVENNEYLEKLFIYRDKVLAHQEHLTDDLRDKLKFLPSLGHMEDINTWVENFCSLSMSLLSNITLLPPPFSARISTLNVVAKLLDKKFKFGSREYTDFYKRLPD